LQLLFFVKEYLFINIFFLEKLLVM